MAESVHAIAMHGSPRHPADRIAFPYVDPDAPKGGRIVLGIQGTFDSLNPLIHRGASASGVREHIYESLLTRAADEPFSLYGHIAASIDLAPDRRTVTFTLRPEARFSDGRPITPEDVVFSLELLREKGWPFMRGYYSKVETVSAEASGRVRMRFKANPDGSADRELPLIVGLMPILPRHAVDPATFEQTTLTPPIGSGPYVVERVEAGRALVLRRNPNWWARELPTGRGRYNLDEIRYDYYIEETALFEAFKSGAIDLYVEDNAGRWTTGYEIPAVREGRIQRRELAQRTPAALSALVFNTRREVFRDQRVRRALVALFDAELANRTIYGGLARRTHSFFDRSELSSFNWPADEREKALLAKFSGAVAPAILDGTARLPTSGGSGSNRQNQAAAMAELTAAGYALSNNRLVHTATGRPLAFEILIQTRAQERMVSYLSRGAGALGMQVTVRRVDSAQFEARLKEGNYDMIPSVWASSLSPGNEQFNRWGSASADQPNTRNYAGVKSPAVDALIDALLAAVSREDFVSAVRSLDRVLRSGDYLIPLFHLPNLWVAHWSHIGPPKVGVGTNSGLDLDTWHTTKPR